MLHNLLRQFKPSVLLLPLFFILTPPLLAGCTAAEGPSGEPAFLTPDNIENDTAISNLPRDTTPETFPGDLETLAAGGREFAFDFYHAIRTQETNLIYSPHSLSSALVMVYAGARGETAQEIADTLHFTLPPDRLHPAFNLLDQELGGREPPLTETPVQDEQAGSIPFTLRTANSTWVQKDYPLLPDYLDLLAKNYGSGLQQVNFEGDSELARQGINHWISERTAGKIPQLILPGVIDSSTTLVLANAVYFQASWVFPFNPDLTQLEPFTLLDGSRVTSPMMSMYQSAQLLYYEGEGFVAVELPYLGERFVMTILLPEAGRYRDFQEALDSNLFREIADSLQPQDILLKLPSFQIETRYSLKPVLGGMGMPHAFMYGRADFSGIDGSNQLFISEVLHAATIMVDEAGTEAAAATAALMSRGMPSADELVVDRPFIYIIRDIPTGTILFAGQVLDPSQ